MTSKPAMRTIVCALLLIVLVCSACSPAPVTLQALYPRESAQSVRIVYHARTGRPARTLETTDPQCTALLDALYASAATDAPQEAFSPELGASHSIILQNESGYLTLYYDQATDRLFAATTRAQGKKDLPDYKSFYCLSAPLSGEMEGLYAGATLPEPSVNEQKPAVLSKLLRGGLDEAALAQEGTALAYHLFDYEYNAVDPLYSVLYAADGVPNLDSDYVLLLAAAGKCPSDGYGIDILSVMENDAYYIVRIQQSYPAADAAVTEQPTYPVSAAMVDMRLLDAQKPVVFLSEADEVLSIRTLDPAALEQAALEPPAATQ